MPTGLRYTNNGTAVCNTCSRHAEKCRCGLWSVPLKKLGLTFSIGLLLLVVLTAFALLGGV